MLLIVYREMKQYLLYVTSCTSESSYPKKPPGPQSREHTCSVIGNDVCIIGDAEALNVILKSVVIGYWEFYTTVWLNRAKLMQVKVGSSRNM